MIRLGYFNVMEAKRQAATDEVRKYYQGLPITSMAIALPIFFLVSPLFPSNLAFVVVLHIVVAVVGFLFILDFKLPKPSARQVFLIVAIVAAAVAVTVFAGRSWWEMVHPHKLS